MNLNAISLRDAIENTITTNPAIISEYKNQDAFKKYVDEEKGDYLPTLDLETYLEKSYTNENQGNSAPTHSNKEGWNAQLKLEQILYDGGRTPSEVNEFRHKRDANIFRSNAAIDNIISDTITTYLDLVQYEELINLSSLIIDIHKDNLVTAVEKEQISGEKLEIHQVSSKLHFTYERFYEQHDLRLQAFNNFKKNVGIEPNGHICRPIINEKVIPNSIEKAVELSVRRNYSILEQVENIKTQREKLTQADASFLPTLLFQLQGEWDDDLTLAENGRQDIYRARFLMTWNLYEGGKNSIVSKREMLFLQEAKKKLDSVTDEIVSTTTNNYNTYEFNKKRVEMLKSYVHDNRKILEVYVKEFDSGTRTFIDILNAEAELYNSKTTLIGMEYELMQSYYDLLVNLSILSDSVLSQKNQVCQPMKTEELFKIEIKKESPEIGELEDLSADEDEEENTNETQGTKKEENNQNSILKKQDIVIREDKIRNLDEDLKEFFEYELEEESKDSKYNLSSQEEKNIRNEMNKLDKELEEFFLTNLNNEDQDFLVEKKEIIKPDINQKQETKNNTNILDNKLVIDKKIENILGTNEKKDSALISKAHEKIEEKIKDIDKTVKKERIEEKNIKKEVSPKKEKSNTIGKKDKIEMDGLFDNLYIEAANIILAEKKEFKPINTKKIFEMFLDAPINHYTLSITTEENLAEGKYFLKNYNILDKGYVFSYGQDLVKTKVLYGVYSTYKEAQKALDKMSSRIKSHSPYISRIKKYQKLYKKYNLK